MCYNLLLVNIYHLSLCLFPECVNGDLDLVISNFELKKQNVSRNLNTLVPNI